MLTEHAEPFRETTLVMAGDSVRSAPPGPDLGADLIVGLELRGADSVPGDAVEALGFAVSAHRRRLGRQRLAGQILAMIAGGRFLAPLQPALSG